MDMFFLEHHPVLLLSAVHISVSPPTSSSPSEIPDITAAAALDLTTLQILTLKLNFNAANKHVYNLMQSDSCSTGFGSVFYQSE